jgi:hypothetical protein
MVCACAPVSAVGESQFAAPDRTWQFTTKSFGVKVARILKKPDHSV